jgi:hypothetical protein
MAVDILVLKKGKSVEGVKVYYRKTNGTTGEKWTGSSGYVSFQVDPGMAALIRISGKGISYETSNYYLQNGTNEFRF